MIQIEHRFVPGIRFDAQLTYERDRQAHPNRSSFVALPTMCSRNADQALLMSILQATAILSGMARQDLLARLRRELNALDAEPGRLESHKGDVLDLVRRVSPELAWKHIVMSSSAKPTWQSVVEPGALHLLCMRGVQKYRWCLVVGIEQASTASTSVERALLVLDSQIGEPWASGHNARLELTPGSGKSLGQLANPMSLSLAYRGLDGEVEAVELHALMELRLRAR